MAQSFYPITPVDKTPGTTGEWTPIDASGDIASGATGVLLHIVNEDAATDRNIGIRKNGSTDDRHTDMDNNAHLWAAIGVDASRIFEVYIGTSDVKIWLVGYTMSGVTFKTNADDVTLIVTGNWTTIDVSTEAPNAIGVILEIDTPSTGEDGGVRKNGSSDNRLAHIRLHNCLGAVIGVDDSQIFEGYVESRVTYITSFFLVGYITDGATFNTNGTDLSLGSTAEWLDLSALPATANVGFIEVNGGGTYGLRKNGSAEDIYRRALDHCWGMVECDASQLIEGKITDTVVDFFLVGYALLGWSGKISGVTNPAKIMGVDRGSITKVKGK